MMIIVKKLFIFVVFLGIILNMKYTALANGAKLRETPSKTGGVIFDEKPNISLIEETVIYNIKEYMELGSLAEVTVKYQLRNLNGDNRDIKMFFVTPFSTIAARNEVLVNGKNISQLCKSREGIPLPENWMPKYNSTLVDPLSKKNLFRPYKTEEFLSTADGIEIPLSMSDSGVTNLEIRYSCESGYEAEGVYNAVSGFTYFLTPARFWSGDVKVNLFVNLPKDGDYEFYSNIAMDKVSKGSYKTIIEKLPNYEWSFSFFRKSSFSFWTNNNFLHSIYTIITSLAVFAITFFLSFKAKRRWAAESIISIGYALALILFLTTYRVGASYLVGIFYLFIVFVLVIVIPIIWIIDHIVRLIAIIKMHLT